MADLASYVPDTGSIMAGGSVFLRIIIVVSIFAAIGFYFWYVRKFNIVVRIYTQGTRLIAIDKATIKKYKDGQKVLRLLKTKEELPIPKYEHMLFNRKNKYVDILKLGEDGWAFVNQLTMQRVTSEIDMSRKENIAQIVPYAARNWHIQQQKRSREKLATPGFMEKYGTILSLGILTVLFILGLWFITGMLNDALDKIPGIIKAAVNSVQSSGGSAF